MLSTSSERQRRIGRALAVSAAAVVVCLVPTACDYTYTSGSAPLTGGGHSGHGASGGGGGAAATAVVVPVARTETQAPAAPGTPTPPPPPVAAPPSDVEAPEEPSATDEPDASEAPTSGAAPTSAEATDSAAPTTEPTIAPTTAPPANNGLDVLGADCTESELEPHDGFQKAPRCVSTSFGEVAAAAQSPSLLITESPDTVAVGAAFQISVSTRNLIRDRFLGAAAGGYYLESSFLDANGLQRGHFHTACRMLDSATSAPDAAPVPAFFLATQDNGGGADADTVTISVPNGMPTAGTAQCAVWAGDGSHRVPMMERANQTPAFDAVRVTVE